MGGAVSHPLAISRALKALPLLLLLSGCYAYRSTAGHLSLLWNRRPIAETIKDPSTAPGRREKLKLVVDARRYAVEKLALSPSRDYKDWTPVDGAVTWLVYACSTASLTPVKFFGYPYKGHFRREQAEREAAAWTKKGFDAAVVPAAAYNTPLPIADPLPSSVLDYAPGDLAELLIHEFAHGTIGHEESTAQWIGERGAEAFLIERFGDASPEFMDWKSGNARSSTAGTLYAELGKLLTEHYAAGRPDREKIFDWARAAAAKSGVELPKTLNNAVVASRLTYRGDPAALDALFEKSGRRWPEFIAALKKRR